MSERAREACNERANRQPFDVAGVPQAAEDPVTYHTPPVFEKVGPDRVKIRQYLASLSGAGPFNGVTGKIRFGSDGDPIGKGIVMTRVKRGALLVESGH